MEHEKPDKIKKICESCGKEFEAVQLTFTGKTYFTRKLCNECTENEERLSEERRQQEADRKREDVWGAICPPLYRETDAVRLPSQFLTAIDAWSYSPKGLGFISPAGMGKTRAAFLLLREMFDGRKSCIAVSSTRLAILCADQFSENRDTKAKAESQMRRLRTDDLLLLDDLGKNKMTERCEMELFDILEERTSHLLPTIWTANTDAVGLKAMLSPDRGDPILRRLCEFSEIVKI